MKYAYEKATGEIYELDDAVTDEKFPAEDWEFDITVDFEALSGVPYHYREIVGGALVEMDQAGKDAVDAAALADWKAQCKANLALECKVYIESKCPAHNQNTLNGLYVEAATNRKAHIKELWDWIETVIAYNQGKQDDIAEAADESAASAITQDFAAYDATWPNVTIASVRAIED